MTRGLKWVPDKLTFRLWLVANSSRSNGAPKTGSLVHFLSWVLGSVHRLVPEGIEFRSPGGDCPSGPPTDWVRACRSRSRFSRQARGGLRAVSARDGPEDGVREPCRRRAPAHRLAGIVDPPRFAATASQRAEVDHRAAGPEECMRDAGRILAGPDDLPGVVDAIGVTCVSARKRAQVGHRAVVPEERVRCAAGIEAPSDHLARVVNGPGFACGAPEGPEVLHPTAGPEERVLHAVVRAAPADDLAGVVDGPPGVVVRHAQIPEVGHRARLPQERVVCPARIEAVADDLADIIDAVRLAVVVPGKRPEVRHRAVVPQERVPFSGGIDADADDLARLVDRRGAGGGAPQGPDVRHDAVLPEEGTGPALADADDLAGIIDGIGETDSAAGERPQVPRGRWRRAIEVRGPVRPGRVVGEPDLPVPHVQGEVDDVGAVDPLLVDRGPIEEESDRVGARRIRLPWGPRRYIEAAEVRVQTVVFRLLDRQVDVDGQFVESTVPVCVDSGVAERRNEVRRG